MRSGPVRTATDPTSVAGMVVAVASAGRVAGAEPVAAAATAASRMPVMVSVMRGMDALASGRFVPRQSRRPRIGYVPPRLTPAGSAR